MSSILSLVCIEDSKPYESPHHHDKTNKMTFTLSEYSDQPWHQPCLIRDFAVRIGCPEETLGPQLSIETTLKTDQTGWMPRLICVFAGRTDHFVGFVMRRLI